MTTAPAKPLASPQDLARIRDDLRARQDPKAKVVRVCVGPGCAAKGAMGVYERFAEAAGETAVRVGAKGVGCHGLCECGPIVLVQPGDVFYQRVEEPDVPEIWR